MSPSAIVCLGRKIWKNRVSYLMVGIIYLSVTETTSTLMSQNPKLFTAHYLWFFKNLTQLLRKMFYNANSVGLILYLSLSPTRQDLTQCQRCEGWLIVRIRGGEGHAKVEAWTLLDYAGHQLSAMWAWWVELDVDSINASPSMDT